MSARSQPSSASPRKTTAADEQRSRIVRRSNGKSGKEQRRSRRSGQQGSDADSSPDSSTARVVKEEAPDAGDVMDTTAETPPVKKRGPGRPRKCPLSEPTTANTTPIRGAKKFRDDSEGTPKSSSKARVSTFSSPRKLTETASPNATPQSKKRGRKPATVESSSEEDNLATPRSSKRLGTRGVPLYVESDEESVQDPQRQSSGSKLVKLSDDKGGSEVQVSSGEQKKRRGRPQKSKDSSFSSPKPNGQDKLEDEATPHRSRKRSAKVKIETTSDDEHSSGVQSPEKSRSTSQRAKRAIRSRISDDAMDDDEPGPSNRRSSTRKTRKQDEVEEEEQTSRRVSPRKAATSIKEEVINDEDEDVDEDEEEEDEELEDGEEILARTRKSTRLSAIGRRHDFTEMDSSPEATVRKAQSLTTESLNGAAPEKSKQRRSLRKKQPERREIEIGSDGEEMVVEELETPSKRKKRAVSIKKELDSDEECTSAGSSKNGNGRVRRNGDEEAIPLKRPKRACRKDEILLSSEEEKDEEDANGKSLRRSSRQTAKKTNYVEDPFSSEGEKGEHSKEGNEDAASTSKGTRHESTETAMSEKPNAVSSASSVLSLELNGYEEELSDATIVQSSSKKSREPFEIKSNGEDIAMQRKTSSKSDVPSEELGVDFASQSRLNNGQQESVEVPIMSKDDGVAKRIDSDDDVIELEYRPSSKPNGGTNKNMMTPDDDNDEEIDIGEAPVLDSRIPHVVISMDEWLLLTPTKKQRIKKKKDKKHHTNDMFQMATFNCENNAVNGKENADPSYSTLLEDPGSEEDVDIMEIPMEGCATPENDTNREKSEIARENSLDGIIAVRGRNCTINKKEPFLSKLSSAVASKLEQNAKKRKMEMKSKLRENGGELLHQLTRKARVKQLPLPQFFSTAKYGMYAEDYLLVQEKSTTLDLTVCRDATSGRVRLPFLARNLFFNKNRAFRAHPEFDPADPPKACVADPTLPLQERLFRNNRSLDTRRKKQTIINCLIKQKLSGKDTEQRLKMERGVPANYNFSLATKSDYSMMKRSALYNDAQFMRFVEKKWMADDKLRTEWETARADIGANLKELREEREREKREMRDEIMRRIDRALENRESDNGESDDEMPEANQVLGREDEDVVDDSGDDDSVELNGDQTADPNYQFDIKELDRICGNGPMRQLVFGKENPTWTTYLKLFDTQVGQCRQFREHELLQSIDLPAKIMHEPPIEDDKDPHVEGKNVVTVGAGYPYRNTLQVTRLRHSLLSGHRTALVEFWYQVWAPNGRKSALFPAHLAVDNQHWALGCTLPVNEKLLATHPTHLDIRQSTFRDMPEDGEIHVLVWVAFSGDLSLKDVRGRPCRDKQKAEEYRSTRREQEFELTRQDWESDEITTFFGTFHLGNSGESRDDAIGWEYGVKSVVLINSSAVEDSTTEMLKQKGKDVLMPRFTTNAVEEIQHLAAKAHGTPFLEMEFYNDDIRTRDLEKKACPLYSGTGAECTHENPLPAISAPRPKKFPGQGVQSSRPKIIVKTVGPEPEPKPEKEWAPVAFDSECSSQSDESERSERDMIDEDEGPPVKPDRSGLPVLDFVKAFSGLDLNFEFETIAEMREKIKAESSIQKELERLIGCSLEEADETQLASLKRLQQLQFPEIIYYRFPHRSVNNGLIVRDRSPPRKDLCSKQRHFHDRWTRRLVRNIPFFRVEQVDKRTKVVRVLKWKDVKKLPEKEKKMMIANFGRPIDFPLKNGVDNGTIQFLHGANAQLSKESTPMRKARIRHSKASKSRVYSKKTVDGMEKAMMKQVVANVTGNGFGPRGRPSRMKSRPTRYGYDKELDEDDEGWNEEEEESPDSMDTRENSQDGSEMNEPSDESNEAPTADSEEKELPESDEEPPLKKARNEVKQGSVAPVETEESSRDQEENENEWKKEWGAFRGKKRPAPGSMEAISSSNRIRKPRHMKEKLRIDKKNAVSSTSYDDTMIHEKIESALNEKERQEYAMMRLLSMDEAELRNLQLRQLKLDAWIEGFLDKLKVEEADAVRKEWIEKGVDLSTWPYESLLDSDYDEFERKIAAAKKEWMEDPTLSHEYKEFNEKYDGRGGSADDLPPRTDANSQLTYQIKQSTTPNKCIMCEKQCRNMFDLMMHYTLTHIRFAFVLRPNIQTGEDNLRRLENALVIDVHLDVDADTTKDLLTYEPRTDKPVDCLTQLDIRRPLRPVKLQSKTGHPVYMTTPMETGLLREMMRMSMLTFTKENVTPSSMRRLQADRVYGNAENDLMEMDHTYKGPGAMTVMDFQTHFWETIHDIYVDLAPIDLLVRYLRNAVALEYPEVTEYDRMRLFLRCNLHIIKEDLHSERARISTAKKKWRLTKKKMLENKANGKKKWKRKKPFVRPMRNLFPSLLAFFDRLASNKMITHEDRVDLKQRVIWAAENPDFFGDVDAYDPIRHKNSPLRLALMDKMREEHEDWLEELEEDDSSEVEDRLHPDLMTESMLRRAMRDRVLEGEVIPLAHHAESEVKRIFGEHSNNTSVPEWMFPPIILFREASLFPSPTLRVLDKRLGQRAYSLSYFNERGLKKRADRELGGREKMKALLTRHFNQMELAKINLRE